MNPIHVTHTPFGWRWRCRLCGRAIRGYADPGWTADRGRNHVRHRHMVPLIVPTRIAA